MTEQGKIEHGIGEWRDKAWGRTRTLFRDDQIEIVECEIVKGGYCSEHLHRNKHNEFRVLSGWLKVIQDCDEEWLAETMKTTVPAGHRHHFLALEKTRLIETYTPAGPDPVDPSDIERFSTGGIRPCSS